MDYQQKDNALYGLIVLMGGIAIGIAYLGYFYEALLVASLMGIIIARHIHEEKKASHGATCPIGEHCYDVITSKYSVFLGISVEVYGLLYYTTVLLGYLVATVYTVPAWYTFLLLAATALAVLFSAYLTFIQAVPLGEWCIWCITSALCCIGIFTFSIHGLPMPLDELLARFDAVTHAVYMFGIALGMGVAITSDILFLDFLRDFEMVEMQATIINKLQEVMWTALAIIVLGAAGYFIPNTAALSRPEHIVSGIAIGTVILNGAALYLFISHRLQEIQFDGGDEPVTEAVRLTRRAAFVMAGVSATSWLTAFFLTFARIPAAYATLPQLLATYGGLLLLGVTAGLVAEFVLKKSAHGEIRSNIPFLFD